MSRCTVIADAVEPHAGVGMGRSFRYWAERIVLGLTATVGIAVTLADQLDLLDGLASDTVPKLTLLILSTVTLFLLFEIDRLKARGRAEPRPSARPRNGPCTSRPPSTTGSSRPWTGSGPLSPERR
jgi:hypothetical protein